jgi:hypothetical protein
MKQTKRIQKLVTVTELAAMLEGFTASTTVSILYETDLSTARTVAGVKQVRKTTLVVNARLNHDYAQKVQRLSGDETFIADPMQGKTRVSGTLVKSDKSGELLLDYKLLNPATEIKRLQLLTAGGEPISEADAAAQNLLAPSHFKERTKPTAGRGCVSEEKNFDMYTLSLKNIKRLRFKGVEYIVRP